MRFLNSLQFYFSKINENPSYMLMKGLARFSIARKIVLLILRTLDKIKNPNFLSTINREHSLFKDIDTKSFALQMEKNGFVTGLQLPKDALEEILAFVKGAYFFVDRDPKKGFQANDVEKARLMSGKNFHIAQALNSAKQCNVIKELEVDPILIEIATRYLGVKPKHIGTNLWWSYSATTSYNELDKAAQVFHYDLDDYKFIKFFFYLTDVNPSNGPHVCVAASHRKKKLSKLRDFFLMRRYSDDEIEKKYGEENIHTILGKAGDGFAEDTLCIHKGQPLVDGERIILQIQFAILDYNVQHEYAEPAKLFDFVNQQVIQ